MSHSLGQGCMACQSFTVCLCSQKSLHTWNPHFCWVVESVLPKSINRCVSVIVTGKLLCLATLTERWQKRRQKQNSIKPKSKFFSMRFEDGDFDYILVMPLQRSMGRRKITESLHQRILMVSSRSSRSHSMDRRLFLNSLVVQSTSSVEEPPGFWRSSLHLWCRLCAVFTAFCTSLKKHSSRVISVMSILFSRARAMNHNKYLTIIIIHQINNHNNLKYNRNKPIFCHMPFCK